MASSVVPPGWPGGVRPPGAPDWERTAQGWLLDVCPSEYRSYPVLRRHILVLAHFALVRIEGDQRSVERGLGDARVVLGDLVAPEVVDVAVETWHRESARLVGVRRAVGLVEEALRGRRFRPRL